MRRTPAGRDRFDPLADVVLHNLRREQVPCSASEVAAWEGLRSSQIRLALQRLARRGLVAQNTNGYWELITDV